MSTHHPKRSLWRIAIALLAVVLLFSIAYQVPTTTVQAQGGQNLPFDAAQLGVVTGPEGVTFTFAGQAGDAVEIEVTGLNNFATLIALQDANGALLAQEPNASRSDVVTLSATLPTSGSYLVVVTGADNTVGQFTILLTRGLPPGAPLTPNGVTEGIVAPTLPQVYYDLPLDGSNNTRLEVRSLTLGYSPQITVFGSDGTTVAILGGDRALAGAFEFGPGTETLKVLVALGDFATQANFQVLWNVITPDSSSSPVATQPASTGSGSCQVTPEGANPVNIRSGGSTDHPVVGVLQSGQTATATGFSNLNGGWYEIQLLDGTIGWAASFVVITSGDCSSLPIKTFPPAPTSQPGATQATATTPAATDPASTQEPGASPTTATATEATQDPGAQTAPPEDTQYFFELDISGTRTATVSNQISYPNGDTFDRVRYEVTGFTQVVASAEVLVTVTCSGPGAENAQISDNFARRVPQSCNGYTRTIRHTNDSDFQNFEIWLESGNNAFVTWTVTATVISP